MIQIALFTEDDAGVEGLRDRVDAWLRENSPKVALRKICMRSAASQHYVVTTVMVTYDDLS